MAKRAAPKKLGKKLRQIRTRAGLSQTEIVAALKYKATPLRASQISSFEHGKREPPLMLLLAYSRFARVPMETLVDDKLKLPD
jgi:transcriptional regulator with XRE-family HTH domain